MGSFKCQCVQKKINSDILFCRKLLDTTKAKRWTVKEEDLESGSTFLKPYQLALEATEKSQGTMEYFGNQGGYGDIVRHHMNSQYKFVGT